MDKLTDAEIIAIAEDLGFFETPWIADLVLPFARAIEQRLAQPVKPTNFVGYATGIEPNSGS